MPQLSPSSAATPAFPLPGLAGLRRTIQALEKRAPDEERGVLSLGIPAVDDALGGGFDGGALHEVSAQECDIAAATGFTLMLAALFVAARRSSPVVWIAEDMALLESGAPYGPGIDEFGLAPERLIAVSGAKSRDVMWATEEALRCRAVSAVIGEVRSNARLDLVVTRRLSLAAARGGAAGFLLRAGLAQEPSAAATRWIVAPASAGRTTHGLAPPALLLRLVRNRRGRLGSWMLEWNRAEQRFESSAHHEPVAPPAPDRPPRAAVA